MFQTLKDWCWFRIRLRSDTNHKSLNINTKKAIKKNTITALANEGFLATERRKRAKRLAKKFGKGLLRRKVL
jgi:hypothetical protein